MTRTARPGSGDVAIVMVNYASSGLIARNHDGVLTAVEGIDLVLVDSFSSAAERDAASELAHRRGWHFVALDANPGFGAAVNVGLIWAWASGFEIALMVNPDALLTTQVVRELRDEVLRDHRVMVSPRIEDSGGAVQFRGSAVDLRNGRIRSLAADRAPAGSRLELASAVAQPWQGWLPGTCLAVHRDLIEQIGDYDEQYFMYWEDVDLSVRCARAGGSLVVRNDLVVVHDEGGTQTAPGDGAKSRLYYRYNCRNRLVFAGLNLGVGGLVRWILTTPRQSWLILLRGGGRRHVLRSPGDLLAVVLASVAGVGVSIRIAVRRRSGRDARLRPALDGDRPPGPVAEVQG